MYVKLLAEHHLEFLSLKARVSLHLSKCHIGGNHMSWLICDTGLIHKFEHLFCGLKRTISLRYLHNYVFLFRNKRTQCLF